jgi:hypothetical protein
VEKSKQREIVFSVLLTKYFSGDRTKKNEMGERCSTYGRQKRCLQGSGGETRGKDATWRIQT